MARDPERMLDDMFERVERPLLKVALSHTDDNQIPAAVLLGINRNVLRKEIADLEIVLVDRK